jgi:hypothetical protein
MTGFLKPEEARRFPCPNGSSHFTPIEKCEAEKCLLWRWRPLQATEPGYKEAVQKAQGLDKAARGGLMPAEYVNANRKKFDLPERPYVGWCGLGGEPKA